VIIITIEVYCSMKVLYESIMKGMRFQWFLFLWLIAIIVIMIPTLDENCTSVQEVSAIFITSVQNFLSVHKRRLFSTTVDKAMSQECCCIVM
jgi:hypothetical protein